MAYIFRKRNNKLFSGKWNWPWMRRSSFTAGGVVPGIPERGPGEEAAGKLSQKVFRRAIQISGKESRKFSPRGRGKSALAFEKPDRSRSDGRDGEGTAGAEEKDLITQSDTARVVRSGHNAKSGETKPTLSSYSFSRCNFVISGKVNVFL